MDGKSFLCALFLFTIMAVFLCWPVIVALFS